MMKMNKSINLMTVQELNDYFKDNILVVDNSLKNIILKKSFDTKVLLTFKLMSESQIQQYILPDINKVCKYIIYKEEQNYTLANEIYNNLKYRYYNMHINVSDDNIKKIDYYINKLIKEGYLKDKVFKNNKKIYCINVNIDYLNVDSTYISFKNEQITKSILVNEFIDIEEEILFTYEQISNLLCNGYDIRQVKVYMPNNYISYFKLFSNYYNIPVAFDYSFNLLSINRINDFIALIDKKGIQKALHYIDEVIINNVAKTTVLELINTYISFSNDSNIQEFLISELKSIKIENISYKNVLEINSITDFEFNENNYNFILGFNNIDFVNYKVSKSFLNEKVKEKLNIQTIIEQNNELKNKILNILKYVSDNNANNLISYCKNIEKKLYSYSKIIDDNLIKITKIDISNSIERFSKSIDSYLYKKELNKKENYNLISEAYKGLDLNIHKSQKESIKANPASVNTWDINNFKKNKNISSTLIEKYYKCNFIFYIENVLGLKQYPKNVFSLHIGTYIHQILDDIVNENMPTNYNQEDLENKINYYSNKCLENNNKLFEYINENKQNYIINKINKYLLTIINIITEQISSEKFEIFKTEEDISFNYKGYNFVGKIDKVLKDDNDNFIVIDYKSGNPELSFDDNILENGINLQNLIYFILLGQKYEKVKFAGTYRYKVVPKISTEDYKDDLKRYGYTNPKVDVTSKIDVNNYKNLAFKKDGDFTAYSKILNDEEFIDKINIVSETINKFINKIEDDKTFKPYPLQYKDKKACEYCPYINICYKNKNDANIVSS